MAAPITRGTIETAIAKPPAPGTNVNRAFTRRNPMLTQRRRTIAAVFGALFLWGAIAAWAVDAKTRAQVRKIDASTPRDVQIAIALSAGPPISDKATVYVLGPQGYEV